MKRPLRDYQDDCIKHTLASLLPGGTHYYTLPTGTGKTRIVTGLVGSRLGRILVLAHRKELIEQLASAIKDDIPTESVGIIMAENRTGMHTRVAVGTVQTLRLDLLTRYLVSSEEEVTTLLIDECHHVTPESTYNRIIKLVLEHYPKCSVIGCTATPYRSDKALMQKVLHTCTFERTIPDMQRSGWLSPILWKSLPMPIDLSSVPVSKSNGDPDYNIDALSEKISPLSEEIVKRVLPFLEKRPMVTFCCDVAHAHEMARAFNKAGIRAASVWGDMKKEDREETIRQWKEGYVQCCCNVGVFTEGFDYTPQGKNVHGLGVVLIARVTQSPSLYLQMLGRGTRLKPVDSCYQDCLVFDVCDNANLIETKQVTLPRVMPAFDIEQNQGDFIRFDGKEEEKDKEKKKRPPVLRVNDPLSRSWVAWGYHEKSQTYYCSLYSRPEGNAHIALLREPSGLYRGYVLLRDKDGVWSNQEITDIPLPLIAMIQHCNHVIAKNGVKDLADKGVRWRSQEPSFKQISYVRRLFPELDISGWTKGQVSSQIEWHQIRPALIQIWRVRSEKEHHLSVAG